MKEDRLKIHRDASKRDNSVFFSWLNSNCVQAKPVSEVRKMMSDIKEPIREVTDDES